MKRVIVTIIGAVFFCSALSAQDANLSYYQEIVPSSQTSLAPAELQELEQWAYLHPEWADSYYPLANAFAATSERVWAVVYGEIFCNLTWEPNLFLEMSSQLGLMFEESLIYEDENNSTISFMEVVGVDADTEAVPFEANFEISIAVGFDDTEKFRRLSIATIHQIRLSQLLVWKEQALPKHGLIRWHQTLQDAGMFEAYDFWLFQRFRPEEYADWKFENSAKLTQFLEWRQSNHMDLSQKNFHRLH